MNTRFQLISIKYMSYIRSVTLRTRIKSISASCSKDIWPKNINTGVAHLRPICFIFKRNTCTKKYWILFSCCNDNFTFSVCATWLIVLCVFDNVDAITLRFLLYWILIGGKPLGLHDCHRFNDGIKMYDIYKIRLSRKMWKRDKNVCKCFTTPSIASRIELNLQNKQWQSHYPILWLI